MLRFGFRRGAVFGVSLCCSQYPPMSMVLGRDCEMGTEAGTGKELLGGFTKQKRVVYCLEHDSHLRSG
jgi:hypothetical protein